MKNVLACFLSLFPLVASDATGGSLRQSNAVKKAKPVEVLVLTEALCPYCEQFLSKTLWPSFQDLGSDVMKVTVIPFGNARIDEETETVQCQHGGGECDANTYELCAIAMVKQVETYLPFLVCNAETLPAGFHTGPFDPSLFHACADKAGIWWEALLACHDTASLAWQVTLAAAKATPEHEYVPYVMLNGALLDDGVDFQTEVCRLFKQQGGSHPKCDGSVGGKNDKLTMSDSSLLMEPFMASETCPNDQSVLVVQT